MEKRPEFAAWEKLVLAQISATENAIKSLSAEIRAQRQLLKVQRQSLNRARASEAKC